MDDTVKAPELVTLVVIAYRQAEFVRASIESAFSQTYQPLEIILSDDGSPDETFAIMQEMAAAYRGPHLVRLNQNTPNLGLIGHVNRIFELAKGILIIPNAGDDISEPYRVQRLYDAFKTDRPLLVHSDISELDAKGVPLRKQRGHPRARRIARYSLLKVARSDQLCVGATCAWNPDLIKVFGPLSEAKGYEDRAFFFRARLAGQVAFVDEKLLRYRRGVGISVNNEQSQKRQLMVQRATYTQHLRDFDRYADAMRSQLLSLISDAETGLANIDTVLRGAVNLPPERIEGQRLALRLITPEDAGFLYALRTNPALNAHLSPVVGTVKDQQSWIQSYKSREAAGTEAYYIITRLGDEKPCGTVRFYNIKNDEFTWGSWVLNADKPSKAALESAVLSFRVAFSVMGLRRAMIDVRIENRHATQFYRRFGMTEIRTDEKDRFFALSAADFAAAEPGFSEILQTGG